MYKPLLLKGKIKREDEKCLVSQRGKQYMKILVYQVDDW